MSDENTIKAYEELVRYLVEPLLKTDEFKLKTRQRDNKVEFLLDAPPHLRGRIIGRGGHIARSLRTLIESAAIPTHLTVSFDIVD